MIYTGTSIRVLGGGSKVLGDVGMLMMLWDAKEYIPQIQCGRPQRILRSGSRLAERERLGDVIVNKCDPPTHATRYHILLFVCAEEPYEIQSQWTCLDLGTFPSPWTMYWYVTLWQWKVNRACQPLHLESFVEGTAILMLSLTRCCLFFWNATVSPFPFGDPVHFVWRFSLISKTTRNIRHDLIPPRSS